MGNDDAIADLLIAHAKVADALRPQLSGPLHAPAEFLAACRAAVADDAVLAAFAHKLSHFVPLGSCAKRLRAQEVLLACARDTPLGAPPPDCALRPLGLSGPCSFRCHHPQTEELLALWRDAKRYMGSNYDVSPGGDALAGASEKVARRRLCRLPLEP